MITKAKKQRKRELKQGVFFQAIFFLLMVFFIGILSVSYFRITKKRTELTKKIEFLKEEIQFLEEEREGLETGISQTEKESYWEEKAREQGYVREGENPVVVVPPEEIQNEEGIEGQSFSGSLLEKIKNFLASVVFW